MKLLITIALFFYLGSVEAQDFSITDYGAKNDDQPDTQAIQAAVDACSENGGGTVIFPAGTWISGTVFLKDNVSIYLSNGATWQGENNIDSFPYIDPVVPSREDRDSRRAMIYAAGKKNLKMYGEGTLYPGGDYPMYNVTEENKKEQYRSRPFGVYMVECENITVDGITMINSAFWMQRYLHCDHVRLNNLYVYNHSNHNNDAVDIDGCKDVVVSNCVLDSSDDAMTLKSEGERACEDITISNCIVSSFATPLKFGTGSVGGFKNITINNIVIKPSRSEVIHHQKEVRGGLAGISLLCVDGGTMENIIIDNVTIDGVQTPIFIKLGNRNSAWEEKTDFDVGKIKNIKINNVTASNTGIITSSITGYKGQHIENVTLSNIRLESSPYTGKTDVELAVDKQSKSYPGSWMFGFDYPAYGFYVNYASNITFNNVEFVKHGDDTRPALQFENTKNSRLLNVRTSEKEYVKEDIDSDKLILK